MLPEHNQKLYFLFMNMNGVTLITGLAFGTDVESAVAKSFDVYCTVVVLFTDRLACVIVSLLLHWALERQAQYESASGEVGSVSQDRRAPLLLSDPMQTHDHSHCARGCRAVECQTIMPTGEQEWQLVPWGILSGAIEMMLVGQQYQY